MAQNTLQDLSPLIYDIEAQICTFAFHYPIALSSRVVRSAAIPCNIYCKTHCLKTRCIMVITGMNTFGPLAHIEMKFLLTVCGAPEGTHHIGSFPYFPNSCRSSQIVM